MRNSWPLCFVFACLGLLSSAAGTTAETQEVARTASFDAVLIVLGNEPLDDSTPTVDMVARVRKAVEFHKQHPKSLLVFTGGKTAGSISEARMMADIAITQGVSTNSIRLEEEARSTSENARLTANLTRGLRPSRVLIVSNGDHLQWAMPIFRKVDTFKNAEPLACGVDRAERVSQMEEYLKRHDNARVRQRLQQLKDGVKGTD
jgi:uncharacterized SAM-binding protein YcdF (DUF218 family)